MYRSKIDMIELWPERTCGAQDMIYNTCGLSIRPTAYHMQRTVKYIADYVKKIVYHYYL